MSSDEEIYECEVKRLFRNGDIKESRWIVRPVKDALADGVTEFRCKDCNGAVKLHGKHVPHGPPLMSSISPGRTLNIALPVFISKNTQDVNPASHQIPLSSVSGR